MNSTTQGTEVNEAACRWPKSIFVAVVISAIPTYGFFVHASREPQWVLVPLSIAWALAWIFAVITAVLIVIRPALRKRAIAILVYMVVVLAAGLGGLRSAFYELIAG